MGGRRFGMMPAVAAGGALAGAVAAWLAAAGRSRHRAGVTDGDVDRGAGRRGVGIDVEDVARWREPRRLANLFTPDELARARSSPEPERHHAGWWAAREAAVKALADEGVTVRQLWVEHDDDGRPRVVVHGREDLTAQLDLSISHSDTTAVALVVRR